MNLEQLTNLSDEELNRLAAEKVMGWHWNDLPPHKVGWLDAANQVRVTWLGTWSPTTDRNQSGELLSAVAARGAKISVEFGEISRVWVKAGDCSWMHVAGNGARAETVAALLAAAAMEGERANA